MTEDVLKQAVEIKHEIDSIRKIKNELEEAKELCRGNTGEVRARNFQVQISDMGCYRKTVSVSSESAWTALKKEISDIDQRLSILQNELSELH